ncbi:MAG TPA: hypothetical protein VHH73_12415, partial [Verrucomicrobiae bacterium]|nr:hypothetical protein [Verrucomicrobiae bacterium]
SPGEWRKQNRGNTPLPQAQAAKLHCYLLKDRMASFAEDSTRPSPMDGPKPALSMRLKAGVGPEERL